ncbi:hypothetical protein [Campylobacter rectus]
MSDLFSNENISRYGTIEFTRKRVNNRGFCYNYRSGKEEINT